MPLNTPTQARQSLPSTQHQSGVIRSRPMPPKPPTQTRQSLLSNYSTPAWRHGPTSAIPKSDRHKTGTPSPPSGEVTCHANRAISISALTSAATQSPGGNYPRNNGSRLGTAYEGYTPRTPKPREATKAARPRGLDRPVSMESGKTGPMPRCVPSLTMACVRGGGGYPMK